MLKALENPHYKKIWEAVIMGRHPEAKSFNVALEAETTEFGCLVVRTTSPFSEEHRKTELATILWDDGVDSAGNERWYCYKDTIEKHCFTICKKQVIILGRPIILEHIINLLSYKSWENRGCITTFKIQETVNQGEYHIDVGDIDYSYCGLCFWQLTKPLHEQTPETWENIAELID